MTSKHKVEFTGKLLNLKDFVNHSKSFIETGSAAGDGVQRALDAGFQLVTSIEAAKLWFDKCVNRFYNTLKVNMYLGKSIDILRSVLKNAPLSVICLDAHVSGELSAGYEDWKEKGENSDYAQDKTIKAELAIILEHSKNHLIIIDDVNGLTDGCAESYMDILTAANPNYSFRFYDENLSGNPDYYYKDKILVAIPQI